MAQKAATRAQEKARAEMEKRRAAAAAKGDKAARQAERKRAEAAARRAVDAAKTPAKDKALLEKEDEKLRQAAQKEARATDAITEQQVVLDGLQASMALATEHTQNTTEVRSALYTTASSLWNYIWVVAYMENNIVVRNKMVYFFARWNCSIPDNTA